jgi:hypothetical protein
VNPGQKLERRKAEVLSPSEENAMKTVIACMIALTLTGSSVAYAAGGGSGGSGTGGIDTQRNLEDQQSYKPQNAHRHHNSKIDW